jgi:hypothetical protein
MSSLLSKIPEPDPFIEATGAEQVPEEAAVTAPTEAPPPQQDDMFSAVDNQQLDSLIENLLADEPQATKSSTKRKSKKSAITTVPSRQPAPAPASSSSNAGYTSTISPDVPDAIIRTQCALYCEHFSELLGPIVGRSDAERKQFVKSLSKLPRGELCATLSSLKGSVCIQNGCAMVKNMVFVGCGALETIAPYADMNCSGLTSEMKQHETEIQNCALEYCIDNFDFIRSKSSPEMRLFTLVTSSALQIDSRNRQMANMQAQQQADQETMQKYTDM